MRKTITLYASLLALALPVAAQPQQAPFTVDDTTGARIYQLSGPGTPINVKQARHFYSYTNQFSPKGLMVFEADDPSDANYKMYPVYDASFNLLSKNAVRAAGGSDSSYGEVQFSQVGEWLYGRDGQCGIWKFDFLGKKKSLAARFRAPRCGALSVGPGDRLLVTLLNNKFQVEAVGVYDPATKKYAEADPGPNFDEAQWTQGAAVAFIYTNAPAFFYTADLSVKAQQQDNHGHPGYFVGSNGKPYKISVKNDTIPNKKPGQIGCNPPTGWVPEHALYDEVTGQRVLTFGCNWLAGSLEQKSMVHFSRSAAKDVWFGTGAWITRYQLHYAPDGVTPKSVTSIPVAETKSKFGCGYWAEPRGASDATGTRVLFESTRAGGCATQVYVAIVPEKPIASPAAAQPGWPPQ